MSSVTNLAGDRSPRLLSSALLAPTTGIALTMQPSEGARDLARVDSTQPSEGRVDTRHMVSMPRCHVFVFSAVVSLIVASLCACTRPNAGVCCVDRDDCQSIGASEAERPCTMGLSCIDHECQVPPVPPPAPP